MEVRQRWQARASTVRSMLSSKDFDAIQKRALAEGLPYQTLIASLLHTSRSVSKGTLGQSRRRHYGYAATLVASCLAVAPRHRQKAAFDRIAQSSSRIRGATRSSKSSKWQ
jgi:hypothetical protein